MGVRSSAGPYTPMPPTLTAEMGLPEIPVEVRVAHGHPDAGSNKASCHQSDHCQSQSVEGEAL